MRMLSLIPRSKITDAINERQADYIAIFRATVIFCAICLSALLATAQQTTFYSNFGPNNSFDLMGGWGICGPCPPSGISEAMTFTAAASGSVSQIDFAAFWFNGVNAANVSLWTSDNGVPGTQIGPNWIVPNLPPMNDNSFATISNITGVQLTAGEPYLLWIQAGDPSSSMLGWHWTYNHQIGLISQNANGMWNVTQGYLSAFDVLGTCQVTDYTIPGLINTYSPTDNVCWASAGSTMVSWRQNQPLTEDQVTYMADHVPPFDNSYFQQRFDHNQGLVLPKTEDFLFRLRLGDGLTTRPTVCDVNSRLHQYGITWVTTGTFGSGPLAYPHAQTVVGIYGDGTETGTFLRVLDPSDAMIHDISFQSLMVQIASVPWWPQWVHF